MSSSSNAVQNNSRLFPPFARKLAQNDYTVYATFADKLAVWLGSERAYYPAARPEIVKLLLTAHATLRRAVGADANSNVPFHISTCIGHPMTAPYARLLKAVHPHRELFVEPELRDQVRHLISTASMPSISADAQYETALPNGLLLPVNGHTPSTQLSSSSVASDLQMPSSAPNVSSPASLPQPLSQAPTMMLNTAPSERSISSFNFSHTPDGNIPTPPSQPAQHFHTVATMEMQQNFTPLRELNLASPTVAHPGGSTSIPKKKKKAKVKLASLVAKDLEELSRKRAIGQEPVEESASLLVTSRSNGTPAFTSSSHREDSTSSSSVLLVDTETSGVESTNASGNANPSSSSAMEIKTEHPDSPLVEIGHSSMTADLLPHHIRDSMEVTNLDLQNRSTSLSASVPDISGVTEYPRTLCHCEEASGGGFESSADAVDMVDEPSVVPGEQTDPRPISVSFTPRGKNAHDVACEASDVDYDILENIRANRRGAGVDTCDGIPAQDPLVDADGQPTEGVEQECLTSTTGLGSETLVPSPFITPNTTLSSGVPVSLPVTSLVDSTSPLPQQKDHRHELESVASSSLANTGHNVSATAQDQNDSSAGQIGRTVDEGTKQSDISRRVPPFFEHELQDPTTTDSFLSSTENISQLSPNSGDSAEAATPTAKPDATLMSMQDTAMSTALRDLQESSPSQGATISPVQPDVFRGKMRILAIHRGSSNNTKISLRFDIPEEHLQALEIWNNRRNVKEGLQESMCISLACYAWKKGGQKSVDQLSALPACWPKMGGLTMDVLYKGRREIFPLSPPFMVAPNGLVDISEFLSPGSNVIELNHRLDMSGYIFILRAHSPTNGQLEEVAQRHSKRQEWQEWLRHVSRPLDIPLPPFP